MFTTAYQEEGAMSKRLTAMSTYKPVALIAVLSDICQFFFVMSCLRNPKNGTIRVFQLQKGDLQSEP